MSKALQIRTFLRVVTFLLAYVLLLAALLRLSFYLPVYSELQSQAATLAIVFTNFFMLTVFLIYRHRSRERWISEEAERWLADRKLQLPALASEWHRNIKRLQLWLPIVLVAIASLFVPETIGLASHVLRDRTAHMGKLRIQVPRTWIEGSHGEEYLWVMTAPGLGRIGFGCYWNRNVPLSEMVFFPVPHPELNLFRNVRLDGETVLAKRTFPLGVETLTCWDLIHNNPFVGPSPKDLTIASISCTTESDHFYASFNGWRNDVDTFYQTLERIRDAQ